MSRNTSKWRASVQVALSDRGDKVGDDPEANDELYGAREKFIKCPKIA